METSTRQVRWTPGTGIVAARHTIGMSQGELAALLTDHLGRNVDQATVSRMERGLRRVDLDELMALRDVFDLSADWFLDGPSPRGAGSNRAKRPQLNWGYRVVPLRGAPERRRRHVVELREAA